MPLVTTDTPSTAGRAPWRGAVVGAIAALVFILGVAVVARATRDGAGGVPREIVAVPEAIDAGVAPLDGGTGVALVALVADAGAHTRALADAGVHDAGTFVDAGPLVGPEGEADAGPADVVGPPIVAADVVAVTLPLIEDCLKKALRFDPSLGGKARVHVVVGGGKLTPTMPGSSSPVLSSCVAAGAATLAWPTAADEHHVVEARIVLDGLRKTVRVESAELVQPEE